jgi:hypothetical protein
MITFQEAKLASQMEHPGTLHLGVVVNHDNAPFVLHVDVSGHLKASSKWLQFSSKKKVDLTRVVPRVESLHPGTLF